MDGRQIVLINEYNPKTGFFKIWGIEADIRRLAKDNTNAYIIGLMACCREIFSSKKHCGLFGGTEQQAFVHFDMMQFTKLQAAANKDGKAKAEALKELNKFLADHVKQIGSMEELKLELGKFFTALSLRLNLL